MPGEEHMAGLLAVGIAILLAIVISVCYALVLRELRQINANLEQLIGLLAPLVTKLCPKRHAKTFDGIHKMSTGVSLVSAPANFPADSHAGRGFFISSPVHRSLILRPWSSSGSLAMLRAMPRASW